MVVSAKVIFVAIVAALGLHAFSPAYAATTSVGPPFGLVFNDPPGNMVVTTPAGAYAGCLANGSSTNTVGESAAVVGCNTGEESVTILDPEVGTYIVGVHGEQNGSLVISAETLDSNGNQISMVSVSTSVGPGSSESIFVSMDSSGLLSISTSQPTSSVLEGGALLLLGGGALAGFLVVMFRTSSRRRREHAQS